ncbi:sigma-54 dependent transcriptional regulator [Thiohalocapsa sp. ML1]|jgi:two-component system, NtrC family, response regulator HupR/HoxA|uniref:sigma-54-dependent transcriptional regulator n=1 Tax=Thiohalocapsa sp. ML1 TaxID=1431688 RepID=UPI0009E9BEBE|nr:sigma-54 dependent transcriptional regulator [Thiohalocapsa sp. ML1]
MATSRIPASHKPSTVLVVEPPVASAPSLAAALEHGFPLRRATTAAAAMAALDGGGVQVVVAEQRLPDQTGLELLAAVRARWPDLVRVLVTPAEDVDKAIADIARSGLYHYLTRPVHPQKLLLTVTNACRLSRLRRDNERLLAARRPGAVHTSSLAPDPWDRRERSWCLDAVVRGPDSPLEPLCDQVARVAPYDIPVLLTGESGTGKELFARALHVSSLRAQMPFVAENCGALPDQLLESELFGHRKGAFTGAVADHIGLFEQADGGTVFLDEIGDVSPAFQVKLLRVLQEGEIRPIGSDQRRQVDVRVIAATNKDLEQALLAGSFRHDLYYRLAGVTLHLPPLRRRLGDLAPIAERLLRETAAAFGTPLQRLSAEALGLLARYHWPGNIRELRSELQRMVILSDGSPELGPQLIGAKVLARAAVSDALPVGGATLRERVEALEAGILSETLTRCGGNKSRAAAELGLSRVGLRSKLARYALDGGEPEPADDAEQEPGHDRPEPDAAAAADVPGAKVRHLRRPGPAPSG